MTGFLRALALHIMLPVTRWCMHVTYRLLQADRQALGAIDRIRL